MKQFLYEHFSNSQEFSQKKILESSKNVRMFSITIFHIFTVFPFVYDAHGRRSFQVFCTSLVFLVAQVYSKYFDFFRWNVKEY